MQSFQKIPNTHPQEETEKITQPQEDHFLQLWQAGNEILGRKKNPEERNKSNGEKMLQGNRELSLFVNFIHLQYRKHPQIFPLRFENI